MTAPANSHEPLPSAPPDPHQDLIAGSPAPKGSRPRPVTRAGLAVSVAIVLLAIAAFEAFFRLTGIAANLALESQYIAKAQAYRGADVVMLGDSRILHGFDPAAVKAALHQATNECLDVYNAAVPGAPPMAQLAWALRLLDAPRRPRIAVIGLSPYMFSTRIDRTLSRESLHTLWRLRDLPTALRAGAGPEEVSTILANSTLETYRFRARIVEMLLHRKKLQGRADIGRDGFIPYPPIDPALQDQRATQHAAMYRDELWRSEGASFGNEQVGYFLELLALLKREGIPTVVVNTPAASQLNAVYGPESLYAEHLAWVQARAHEAGATFADARTFGLADDQFIDGDHLDHRGATAFSTRLARDFIAPALDPGSNTGPSADCPGAK